VSRVLLMVCSLGSAASRRGCLLLLPAHFVRRMMGLLVRAGILIAKQGPLGGIRLARCADQITMLEVIEAVDGPWRSGAPRPAGKDAGGVTLRLGEPCRKVTEAERRALARVSLAELAVGGR
jgi:DNA-binding IscR family transcriptional regulator